MQRILITGANGQLGQSFKSLAEQWPAFSFVFAGSNELDITKASEVRHFIQNNPCDLLINCAAYTAVDKAENEPEKARKVNVAGARNLAKACADKGIFLVHFSTDYVYHSHQNTPFKEGDPVSPKGVYAKTKLAGENAVHKVLPNAMIVRTSWVYAPFGHNFVKTMLRLGHERTRVSVVSDQIGSPTYAADLAGSILHIWNKIIEGQANLDSLSGIWHYSNEGVASWYDFACAIFEITGSNCKAVPIAAIEYPTPAKRPPFSLLDKHKIKQAFQIEIPHWRESLRKCLDTMQQAR